MNCFVCEGKHKSVNEMMRKHPEVFMPSPFVCALGKDYEKPATDRREGSRKPSLDYYDRH